MIDQLITKFNSMTIDPFSKEMGQYGRILLPADILEFESAIVMNADKLKSEISELNYRRIMKEVYRLKNLNYQFLPYSDLLQILRECKKTKIDIQRKKENSLFAI